MSHYITTFTGNKIYFDDLENNKYDIKDIIHSLAYMCRYAGHTDQFYTVAKHCILGTISILNYLKRENPDNLNIYRTAYGFLMHDATEAYLCDIPDPLKKTSYMTGYMELEDKLAKIINTKFRLNNLTDKEKEFIRYIDKSMLPYELKYLRSKVLYNMPLPEKYNNEKEYFDIEKWLLDIEISNNYSADNIYPSIIFELRLRPTIPETMTVSITEQIFTELYEFLSKEIEKENKYEELGILP